MCFSKGLRHSLLPVGTLFLITVTVYSILPSIRRTGPDTNLFRYSLLNLCSVFVILDTLVNSPGQRANASIVTRCPHLDELILITSIVFSFLALTRSTVDANSGLRQVIPRSHRLKPTSASRSSKNCCGCTLFRLKFTVTTFFAVLCVAF